MKRGEGHKDRGEASTKWGKAREGEKGGKEEEGRERGREERKKKKANINMNLLYLDNSRKWHVRGGVRSRGAGAISRSLVIDKPRVRESTLLCMIHYVFSFPFWKDYSSSHEQRIEVGARLVAGDPLKKVPIIQDGKK